MGCISTKKQTKDEDDHKEEKCEGSPAKNGNVEITEDTKADVEVTDQGDVQICANGTQESSLDEFRQNALESHNRLRAQHQASPLTLDAELNASAQKWAENIAKLNTLKHTAAADRKLNDEMFGENLAYKNFGSSDKSAVDDFDPSADDMVMMWYNESVDPGYKYGDANMQKGTGHFTQVVWKESARLGIGKCRVQDGNSVNVYVVGQYIPAGNFNGEFAENVLPKS